MWHKPCRTFHPWCPCIKTSCLCIYCCQFISELHWGAHFNHHGVIGLTLKWPGHCFQNVILFSNDIHNKCNTFVSNRPNTMKVESALWILMAWCFSTRASLATVLSRHSCVSRYLRVKIPLHTLHTLVCNTHFQQFTFIEYKHGIFVNP